MPFGTFEKVKFPLPLVVVVWTGVVLMETVTPFSPALLQPMEGVICPLTVNVGVTDSVTVAVADFEVSALLVAVIVAGAVYTPAVVMVPVEAVQVTPAFEESLATVAVKVWVPAADSVAVAGVTDTLIAGGGVVVVLLVPLPPQPSTKEIAVKAAKVREIEPIVVMVVVLSNGIQQVDRRLSFSILQIR